MSGPWEGQESRDNGEAAQGMHKGELEGLAEVKAKPLRIEKPDHSQYLERKTKKAGLRKLGSMQTLPSSLAPGTPASD